jgi:hypothetical protein
MATGWLLIGTFNTVHRHLYTLLNKILWEPFDTFWSPFSPDQAARFVPGPRTYRSEYIYTHHKWTRVLVDPGGSG